MTKEPIALYYWPTIQGRGEFVRLLLEEAAAPYVDVVRQHGKQGMDEMMRLMRDDSAGLAPLAPPFVRIDGLIVAQTAHILGVLGPRLGLVPADEVSQLRAVQLQLTISDLVAEVHDTHHPIAVSQPYERQRPEARKRAAGFVTERLPKFLGYFERALGGRPYFLGDTVSYVDLSMFQVMSGLAYAFPLAMEGLYPSLPGLLTLRERVAARPRIRAYLHSERRLPFNQMGIFRHYPELDAAAGSPFRSLCSTLPLSLPARPARRPCTTAWTWCATSTGSATRATGSPSTTTCR